MEPYDSSIGAGEASLLAAFFSIPAIILWVIYIIGMWKIFTKAGKPGWAAIIPIYNIIVLLEIIGKPIWWLVLFLIPCVNIVFAVWAINLLSKSFGQSEGFTIGLLLLGFIFFPILGFGNYQYLGPAGAGPVTPNFDPNNYNPPPKY
ncbi:DUF5684 domain-containing protein [Mucilaginibacter sp. UR6-1]|uniref:DUF5684 domain-containing protein n=1 Tax=Mucilaginibacter sp. UR6-1 TaxID=1435643 RepID=UPI001E3B0502|nr:DUF5684 domain-containing protein [Mucilaginibacter sp. UR6-1]MCC8408439.1 DUF5684 domain-containing protein [Mucilaginibacter sp. UR6-1]